MRIKKQVPIPKKISRTVRLDKTILDKLNIGDVLYVNYSELDSKNPVIYVNNRIRIYREQNPKARFTIRNLKKENMIGIWRLKDE